MNEPASSQKEPAGAKYRLSPEKAALIRTSPPVNMSVFEGAAYLGISPRKLRDLIQTRKVRAARIGSKIVLRREYLDELVTVG